MFTGFNRDFSLRYIMCFEHTPTILPLPIFPSIFGLWIWKYKGNSEETKACNTGHIYPSTVAGTCSPLLSTLRQEDALSQESEII